VKLAPLLGRRIWTIFAIVGTSAGAGVAEAGVLALVAHVAAAMSTGAQRASVDFGPIESSVPVSTLLAIAGGLAIVRLVLHLIIARLPARLSGEVQSHLRTQVFDAFLAASWPEKAKEKEGHLQELMGGQSAQAGNAVLQLTSALTAGLMFLTLAASAFVLSAGVALLVLGTSLVLFACIRPLARRVRRRSAAASAASMSQASGVAESVRLAEEVQVFDASGAERSRLQDLVLSQEESYVRTRTLARVVPVVYQSAVIMLLVAGLAFLYGIGTTRLAALGAVVLLLVRASAYGQQFLTGYQGLGEALPYVDRLNDVIARFRASRPPSGNHLLTSLESIEFRSVSFAYRPGSPVLRDVSFRIRAGEAIGVVGPSGAGKSTLVQLLLRLREPFGGIYLGNDSDAREFEDTSWRRKVTYLPQEPHVLAGTVFENIRFFRDWIDEESVERAARLAHIHDDIVTWDDGYRTVIGQRADAVSVGQRQRLCLARALAGQPELLVLDEPTSSLDLQSERLIQQSLEGLRGSLTLIVIAHRLTTLGLCDRVMVIRDGRLEAFAPAEHLYGSNDFYRRAVDLAAAGGRL
jgi:ABC-type multidrug transport system fused ATPase/permease subunit